MSTQSVLLLYSSVDGQTRRIAERISARLQNAGYACEVVNLNAANGVDVAAYSKVLIGASVRYGYLPSVLYTFVQHHADALNALPTAFFCVNLTARKANKCSPETNAYTRKFLATVPWVPRLCGVFAGALLYPQYTLSDRLIIQFIMRLTGGDTDASRVYEYTNWQQVDEFADAFAALPLTVERVSKPTVPPTRLQQWLSSPSSTLPRRYLAVTCVSAATLACAVLARRFVRRGR